MAEKPVRFLKPTPGRLLARILDEPDLVGLVQGLAPQVLGKLIEHVGLEDSGELVALATTEQLQRIFDDDLWRGARPGQDQTFDADRFALWLQVMLEAGEEFAARTLAELPEDLVTLALLRQLLVIDADALALEYSRLSEDDDLTDKALASCLSYEFAEFQVLSRSPENWDAILAVLLALDRDHHEFLRRMLSRCCAASTEFIEENGGLYNVLSSAEMLEADVASEREDRRAREGFVAPSAAAAFLALARTADATGTEQTTDPITRSYFRRLSHPTPPASTPRAPCSLPPPEEPSPRSGSSKLAELLRAAEILPGNRPPLLLKGGKAKRRAKASLLGQALLELIAKQPELQTRRLEELAYLANVLVAGCSFRGRAFRPIEAAEAAMAGCNLGLERMVSKASAKAPSPRAVEILAREGADRLFRRGWQLLHDEVVLPAGRAVLRVLTRKPKDRPKALPEREIAVELKRAAQAMGLALSAGKPWECRNELEVLEVLLAPHQRTAVLALLEECPSLAGPLKARAEVGSSRGSFIATLKQVWQIRAFLAKL
jgi:hypothetical protein